MEDTYTGLMKDATARVRSAYAKRLLASIDEVGGGDNLFAKGISLVRTAFTDLWKVPDFVGSAVYVCLVALLLKLLADAMQRERISRAADALCGLLLSAIVVGAAWETLDSCALYMQDITLFFGVLAPVIGMLTAAGGNLTTAGTGSIALSVFLSAAEWITTRFVPLAATGFLSLALIGVTDESSAILKLAKEVRNLLFGIFSLLTSIFFIIVSCQHVAAVQADSVGAKTLKLLVSNAVPIVGGAIGDALKLVGGSLITIKNTAGLSAVLFLVAMFFPVLLRIWLWGILLSMLGFFCECFGLHCGKNLFLQVKCAFDFTLAANASIVVMGFLNIGLFMSSLPAVAT